MSDPKRSWSVKIDQIENVIVKKTFAGSDQTTLKLMYRYNPKAQSIILLDVWKRTEQKLQSFDWEKDQKPKAKWARKSS